MSISQSILPELVQEMAGTRRELERVPDDRLDWRPHPKSMTLGRLASHLAELPSWGKMTLETTELDIAPPGHDVRGASLGSRSEILALFDQNLEGVKAAISAASDADYMVPWSLIKTGKTIFTLPRIAVLRSMCLNHNVHHRAQLGVYLRLLGVAVPGMYGPTADDM